jgi:hypothetical protein
LINLYQLYRLLRDRLSLRLPEKERALLRKALIGLDDAQIARLLGAGALSDLEPGTSLPRKINRSRRSTFSVPAALA